jgi:hypothetical protein
MFIFIKENLGRFVNVYLWNILINENLPKLAPYSFCFFIKENWLNGYNLGDMITAIKYYYKRKFTQISAIFLFLLRKIEL